MEIYTFKARSIAEALRVVRAELGADASVLHTRDIGSPLLRLLGGRLIEVTASAEPRRADPIRSLSSAASMASAPPRWLPNWRRRWPKTHCASYLSMPTRREVLWTRCAD